MKITTKVRSVLLAAFLAGLPASGFCADDPLPVWVNRYFEGVAANDAGAVAAAFAADGAVLDVSRRIAGRSAIEAWTRREVLGGRYALLDWAATGGGVRVLLRFSPPPGTSSGFKAFYTFTPGDGLIALADLQYAPADASAAVAASPAERAALGRTVGAFVTAEFRFRTPSYAERFTYRLTVRDGLIVQQILPDQELVDDLEEAAFVAASAGAVA